MQFPLKLLHLTKIIVPLADFRYKWGMDTKVQESLQPQWMRGLLDADAYPHSTGQIQLIETHISWVFLTGKLAYKIKKPVDLGFVDFSSLERRKFFCEEELRLNRRTSADFYLDIVPIACVDGRPRIGVEPAAEYAVCMRQFPADARLDRRLAAGRVKAHDLQQLAVLLAAFHSRLPARAGMDANSAAERACAPALNNFQHIQGDHISAESRLQIDAIETWTRRQAEVLKPVFERRAADGFVRECHGDLHLANLFESAGRIYPFDCLEFNPELRWIDQVSDIAFLVMDLTARGSADLAYIFLNTWLEESGDYEGLAVLRFYLVYRSMVLLKVASIQTRCLHRDARREQVIKARQYLELARNLMAEATHPRLVIMHGMSASGKTHASARLIPAMPAIRVRSDLERKRLHSLPRRYHPKPGSAPDLYNEESTNQTYGRLAACCETGLMAGFNMIADATFSSRKWRKHFLGLARGLGATPAILECRAPLATLKDRIRQRTAEGLDESDADLQVLEHQLSNFEPLGPDERRFTLSDVNDLLP